MSRIHEALKRVEEERARQSGMQGEAAEVSPAAVAVGASDTGMPSFSAPFSLETLLARSVPANWKPDAATMLFINGANDAAKGTEEFRTLRSRLYHVRDTMTLKRVLVTSALPREGKSFTAANLAQVMVRQHGRRALLIDADLRAPRRHEMLGAKAEPGLSDYLQEKCDELAIIQRGSLEGLFFIPCGGAVADPSELVGNGRLKLLLQRVESLFDWIIIDSPPAIPVSDAGMLAKVCDGVVMVVRSSVTPYDVARKAREEFAPETLVGVVLNGTEADSVPYSRYYYKTYQKDAPKS